MSNPAYGVGRAPCGGWPAERDFKMLGSASGFTNRHLYANTTEQREGCGAPAPRDAGACVGGSVVAIDYTKPCTSVVGSGTDGPGWPTNERPATETGGAGDTIIIGFNTYEKLPTFKPVDLCHSIGFKSVQAYKQWQGSPGFSQDSDEACSHCESSRPSVKYLTCTRTIVARNKQTQLVADPDCTVVEFDKEQTWTQQSHVDVYGNTTQPICSFPADNGSGISGYSALLNAGGGCGQVTLNGTDYGNIEDMNYTLPQAVQTCTMSRTTLTYTRYDFEYDDCTGTVEGPHSKFETWVTMTVEYSDEYTFSDVLTAAKTLLGEWDLADDSVYPWRTDEYVSIAPLLTYREGGAAPGLVHPCTIYDGTTLGPGETEADHQQPWIEQGYTAGVANPPLFDGAIIGKPAPLNDEGHFDFSHRTWDRCGSPIVTYYPSKLGARSGTSLAGDLSDAAMPKTATQWTENNPNLSYPAGAFIKATSGGVYVQKWAQTMLPIPSYDFARPYGPVDQAIIDPATVNCASNPEGDPRFPDAPTDPTYPDWADNRRKGDYIYCTWSYDLRADACAGGDNTTVTLTQSCLPYLSCGPAVICISPDGEEFVNGITHSFATPVFDMDFGGYWQAIPILGMPDPLWQTPHVPCVDGHNFTGAWVRDNGSCQEDSGFTMYYAQPNQFEAILTTHKPAGSPPLPSGVTLVDSVAAPSPVYCDQSATSTEWGNFLRRRTCACALGRFEAYYKLGLSIPCI